MIRLDCNAQKELIDRYQMHFVNESKKLLYGLCCNHEGVLQHPGSIVFSRWRSLDPQYIDLDFQTKLEQTQTSYDYPPSCEESSVWHVNFSDPTLFIAYRGGLFAQDEIQAAEHPVLGHLKEYLSATYKKPGMDHARPMTKDGDLATPILIQGANRHCHVQTDRNLAEGRPKGLYGNQFKGA